MKRFRISLDWDGVLGEFNGHCENLFGAHPHHLRFEDRDGSILKSDAALWRHVETCPEFWLEMPLKPGAHEMVDLCRPYGVQFVSGCPASGYERAEAEKRIKFAKHFPDIEIVTCRSKDKANFIQQPGDILVDDMPRNVKRWIEAGGYGIRYRDHEQAMLELRYALKNQFPEVA